MELVLMVLESENRNDEIISLLRPGFLQNQKRYADASQRLEEILKSRPDNYFAAERLLLVLYEMKDFKTLEKRGEELASRFNRSVFAKILYSSGAMENGNYDVALEELRKADILAGSNNEIRMQVITQAMKIDNSDLTVMNNYAYYLAEQNMRLKEAEKMARTVIEREKKNNTFLDTYAWVLYKRGKAREAARIMEKIITTGDSDDAEYYEHYGYILKKLGKCRDAIRNWEIAIRKDESKSELKKEIGNCKR
jgi:tetratricopeptide (TPR) repeat protein